MEWTRLVVEGLGPISRSEVTIRPITVIIGRNCVGKSLLLNLAYLLSDTLPDFPRLREEVDQEANERAEQAYEALTMGDTRRLASILAEMLHAYLGGLGPAVGSSLAKRFREFFNVEDVADLLSGRVVVSGSPLSYTVEPRDGGLVVRVSGYRRLGMSIERIERLSPETYFLEVKVEGLGREAGPVFCQVKEPLDIRLLVGGRLLPHALSSLHPLSFGVGESFLLTDSRAGILRLARTATATSLEYGRLLVPARESAFLAAYNRLAARFREQGPLKELEEPFRSFLVEMGLRNVEVRLVGGYPEVLVEDMWGRKLLLEECPSGVRESLSVALALVTEGRGTEALFVEEIESHIHPKALGKIVSLAWEAVLKREKSPVYLVLTTHNPIVLSKLNNLILKTGGGLHKLVTVVHLKEVEGSVVSEELEVGEEGFDESCLGEIFVELLEERAALT